MSTEKVKIQMLLAMAIHSLKTLHPEPGVWRTPNNVDERAIEQSIQNLETALDQIKHGDLRLAKAGKNTILY